MKPEHIWEQITESRIANSRTCNWEYNEDDNYWAGDCGISFCIEEETPSKNDMNYCPKCGGKLVEFLKVKVGAVKCQSCLGTGKCAKSAIIPEPPDVQCPVCRGTGKGGVA